MEIKKVDNNRRQYSSLNSLNYLFVHICFDSNPLTWQRFVDIQSLILYSNIPLESSYQLTLYKEKSNLLGNNRRPQGKTMTSYLRFSFLTREQFQNSICYRSHSITNIVTLFDFGIKYLLLPLPWLYKYKISYAVDLFTKLAVFITYFFMNFISLIKQTILLK